MVLSRDDRFVVEPKEGYANETKGKMCPCPRLTVYANVMDFKSFVADLAVIKV